MVIINNQAIFFYHFTGNKFHITRYRRVILARKKTNPEYKEEVKDQLDKGYIIKKPYYNSRTKMEFKHEHCGHKFEMTPQGFKNAKIPCPECRNKNRHLSNTVFRKQVLKTFDGDFIPVTDYVDYRTEVVLIHLKCGRRITTTPRMLFEDKNCNYCSGYYIDMQSLREKSIKEDEDESLFEEYIFEKKHGRVQSDQYLEYMHTKCGITQKVRASDFIHGRRCPNCSHKDSTWEKIIKKYLNQLNLNFKTEHSFDDLKNKAKLRFDFAILDKENNLKCLVEYDGPQHFRPVEYFGGIKGFKKRKQSDHKKNIYCLYNDIPLIRISTKNKEKIKNKLKKILVEEKDINESCLFFLDTDGKKYQKNILEDVINSEKNISSNSFSFLNVS
jgi:ssDNA-binding Zn-finger/Zn-ribbon topoisomerase 1/PII-like signaling protein